MFDTNKHIFFFLITITSCTYDLINPEISHLRKKNEYHPDSRCTYKLTPTRDSDLSFVVYLKAMVITVSVRFKKYKHKIIICLK